MAYTLSFSVTNSSFLIVCIWFCKNHTTWHFTTFLVKTILQSWQPDDVTTHVLACAIVFSTYHTHLPSHVVALPKDGPTRPHVVSIWKRLKVRNFNTLTHFLQIRLDLFVVAWHTAACLPYTMSMMPAIFLTWAFFVDISIKFCDSIENG